MDRAGSRRSRGTRAGGLSIPPAGTTGSRGVRRHAMARGTGDLYLERVLEIREQPSRDDTIGLHWRLPGDHRISMGAKGERGGVSCAERGDDPHVLHSSPQTNFVLFQLHSPHVHRTILMHTTLRAHVCTNAPAFSATLSTISSTPKNEGAIHVLLRRFLIPVVSCYYDLHDYGGMQNEYTKAAPL